MKQQTLATLVALAFLTASAAAASKEGLNLTGSRSYYKVHPQFHPYPEEKTAVQSIDRFGPVGIGIFLIQPAFKMQVKNVEPGSPADATGKLKKEQFIDSINGRVLKDMDPRLILGDIIAKAEATDGVVKLVVRDKADAPPQEVIVKIPVLGAYGKTWPLNDAKSDKIVRNLAEYIKQTNANGMGLGALFLLSTGEEKDLEVVRGWMRKMAEENKDKKQIDTYPWYAGYGGMSLCEYYLRTGDESVLHTIKLYAECMQRTQFNGAWGQKGIGSCSYSQSGHLNAAGVHVLTFLMLAKECGVAVDETMLQSALKYFYKFAGHGNVSYGDSLPETSFVDNGKTGGLAFALGAAASLTPEGEKSVYAKARDISAGKSFYSTSWMLHGHTGGGIGEIWRGAAMGLMHEKQPGRYREFMNDRAWFYDLSRRFDGSFGIIGGGRYDDPADWGLGMGLAYTIPRKHLRIAGGAPTKFCKKHPLPERPWGSKADEAFYSLEAMPVRGGKPQDVDKVTLEEGGSWPVLRKLTAPDVSDETLLQYAHHPEVGIREYAMGQIKSKNRTDLVLELLKSKDPRARHAGILGITEVNDEIAGLLLGMVADPEESWWVARAAMEKLEPVRTELLVPHKDRIVHWLKHPDWWMNNAALSASKGLLLEKEYSQEIMPIIGDLVTRSIRPGAIWQLEKMLRDTSPEVKTMALQALEKAYAGFPKTVTTAAGLKVDTAEPVQVGAYAWLMARLPSGFDSLYKLGTQRYPNQTLAHQKLFLEADYETFGPELRQAFQQIVREKLIPEFIGYTIHIGSNRKLLTDDVTSAVPFRGNLYVTRPRIDDLVDFHRRLGSKDYEWHDFGPAINTMKWDYHTFDPPEPCAVGATARYRKVTLPAGMENWFAKDFDAAKAGWKSGLQPIGQIDGKLGTLNRGCRFNHCRCGEPMQTLWEKEVLLARGNFTFPKFKEGHRYRLIFGGMSHPGEGDGFQVYVNGKLMLERASGTGGGRENGILLAYNIDKAWWPDFENGNTTIAAKGFLPIEPTGTRNTFQIWLQEMKCPPFGEKEILESVKAVPMFSAAWQAVQDPENLELDPENGKYRWDGKFAPNPKVAGTWTQVGEVASAEAFAPAAQLRANGLLPTKLTFAADGRTDDYLIYYTGDTLLHLNTNQALGMSIRTVDGVEYLFIEAGGFSAKNPATWKCPVVVFKKE
ncbi:MAG TPA: DUF6288 domain-containing protein [Luteolibacter sp.]|nr:DUF6288 domain-containing protein [Luteolibacter sp.]